MGGMIATKLAALAPFRVSSLTIMSVTGGGTEVLPRTWKGWKYVFKVGEGWWGLYITMSNAARPPTCLLGWGEYI
jgi:pimeloyl-ACP methyl ester carboxylesterase